MTNNKKLVYRQKRCVKLDQTLSMIGFFYFPTKNNGCRHVKTELNKSAFDLKSKKRVFHNL